MAIPSIITPQERMLLLREIDALLQSDFDGLPDWYAGTVAYDAANRVTMLTQLNRYLPRCGSLIAAGALLETAAHLLDTEVTPQSAIYLNKTAGSDATHRHQDGYYFMITPCEAVTLWLALDETDEENGCLWYEPGSHRQDLLPHEHTRHPWIPNRIVETNEPGEALPVSLSAGDAVAHHARAVHAARWSTE